jgi:hypothetical protein
MATSRKTTSRGAVRLNNLFLRSLLNHSERTFWASGLLISVSLILTSCANSDPVTLPYTPSKRNVLGSQNGPQKDSASNGQDPNSADGSTRNEGSNNAPDPLATAELTAETLTYLSQMPDVTAAALKAESYLSSSSRTNCVFIARNSDVGKKIAEQPVFKSWQPTSLSNVFKTNRPGSFEECRCLVESLTDSTGLILNPLSAN